ncbi:BPSS1780 family membrane protein [Paraburkholderia sp.]|uniref:BPSS1780 family membrane protein n=1 Tax=Paraburkholderia sp. TaxID=1926495 RepID=UPI00239AC684|nr:BPSS1780 family membrane protein [Paraburkholderia sp.]MDE1182101.1 BPSS1780 family membrane protein [Paraburkholderia sp.]
MQLIEVPAKTGYVWFRQGIWLFRKNPFAFLTLFFTYLVVMTVIAHVPVIGGVLPLVFIPGVAVGFMAACRDTIAGKPVFPTILVDGFRSYGNVVAKRLFGLGLLYIASMAVVLLCSALVDGGLLLQLMIGTADPDKAVVGNLRMAVLAALVLYLPVAMLFWFAPVLTAWHDVPPVKAMFFSIVSCWRNRGAFVVFGALWFAVSAVASFVISALMQALGGDEFAIAAVMPVTIIIVTMLYCSFYATYRGCFGVQDASSSDLPTTPAA